jgi:serine/threonine protein kinase/Tol biopolymer transport system component
MALAPGSNVGHYRIVGTLGAGGMGEVYRAHDTKLGREVALKILPEAVSADAERRARFAREARALAALNHPNIAQVYGFEDGEPASALIMELVEGDDLSERIRRGAIPYDDAIAIARQIGEALQAAHDRGIIHRDLKPANIKVRDDGTIKVLDFGLAKALDQGSGIGAQGPGDFSNSPTLTTPAMTLRGMILGTAAYMSPEQAKGRVVDRRADIWAFGCVLYEMLTGRKAFAGDDVSDTLASILKSDVDWNGVPPQVVRLLKKCLEKDPRKRLHDIGDAWDLLDDQAARIERAPSRSSWLPWTLTTMLLVSTIALVAMRFLEPRVQPTSVRFQIGPPDKHDFDIYVALSPDGKRLAFTAIGDDRVTTLWVRDLELLEAHQLPGSEGAWSPFWSPDGKFLAFAVGRALKKIDLSGGPPQTIAEVPGAPVGVGAWNRDGIIVFGARGSGPMRRIPAAGGKVENVTALDTSRQESTHSFPVFLPDGRRFLYWRGSARQEFAGIYLGSLDKPADQQDQRLITAATMGPVALASGPSGNQLLVFRDGVVLSQPFDVNRTEVSGELVTLAERVGSSGSFGFFSASGDVFVYRTGQVSPLQIEQLTWMNRKGESLGTVGEPLPMARNPYAVAISPDEKQVAVMNLQPTTANVDLWTVEFARGIATRITFSDASETGLIWSPDGSRLAFRSGPVNALDIFTKDLNGTADEAPLTKPPMRGIPTDWSADGRFVIFSRGTPLAAATADIYAFDTKSKTMTPLLQTSFDEADGHLSSVGAMLAYTSNESGTTEIYLRPFLISADGKPSVGPKWRVSTAGGSGPRWRGDGKELFFRGPGGEVMAADVTATAGAIQTGLPRKLFSAAGVVGWDVTNDGQRFLMSRPAAARVNPSDRPDPVTVVLNWQAALQKK